MRTPQNVFEIVKELLDSQQLSQEPTPEEERARLVGDWAQMIAAEEALAQQYAGTYYKG